MNYSIEGLDVDFQGLIDKIRNKTIRGYSGLVKSGLLRIVFDMYAHEWKMATLDEKLDFISAVVEAGFTIGDLVHNYKNYIIETKAGNGVEVAKCADDAVAYLFTCYVKRKFEMK